MSQKSKKSKYDRLILDIVYKFKLIEKAHIYCLLKNCKKNSKIEERLSHLVSTNKIYKAFISEKNTINKLYYSKHPKAEKPYWVKKDNRHALQVERIAFYKAIQGLEIICEDYIPNTKIRFDICVIEDNTKVYYEIEMSRKKKWEIRSKLHEYEMSGLIENVKLVFKNTDLKESTIKQLGSYYDKLLYEPLLIEDYATKNLESLPKL
jgi:hypothetical protein